MLNSAINGREAAITALDAGVAQGGRGWGGWGGGGWCAAGVPGGSF